MLVEKEYKNGNDNLGRLGHWESSRKLEFDHTGNWYEHQLMKELESKKYKT